MLEFLTQIDPLLSNLYKMNLRNEVTVLMQVCSIWPFVMHVLTVFQDPVMAEYITIMIINNKTPGKCA